ncbi:dihydroorotase [candidate division WOR-3 bacterium]|uniref:Dihydroorotase n=1 Tax=candidate division WOR-3 bacterium TaxID=2052148 RepID=A0A660SG74_UNCW3|nr:MAG: dihydroorotase [candidate division WOR-3 bacterium]
MSSLIIRGGRVIDPPSGLDGKKDIEIREGKIVAISNRIRSTGARVIDARDYLVVPGFIDLHCHLRDPGRPDEETIESGARAAVHGGFTTICCMPNTEPPIDNEGVVQYVIEEAKKARLANVLPVGAITVGRKGEQLTEIGRMVRAGIVAISDDGDTVRNPQLLRSALEYAQIFNIPVMEHCLDTDLHRDGVINEDYYGTISGLSPSPAVAEESIIARDLLLARFTGGRLHILHLTTETGVKLVSWAKAEKIRVTAETCPHYLVLTDKECLSYDTNFKVTPPLRSERDRKALIRGIKDGTIDAIATDHAPHASFEKELEFDQAASGMIGLETCFPLLYTRLVRTGILSLKKIITLLSTNPAKILGLKTKGRIAVGFDADITLIETKTRWRLTPDFFFSRSKNSPFIGERFIGRVVTTIVGGVIRFQEERPK